MYRKTQNIQQFSKSRKNIKMTTQEKNVEIALMLGWTLGKKQLDKNGRWNDCWFDTDDLRKTGRENNLMFDSDANWQYEAIKKVEEEGYELSQWEKECDISTMGYRVETIIAGKGNNRMEATFDALFQLSQYLKQKI